MVSEKFSAAYAEFVETAPHRGFPKSMGFFKMKVKIFLQGQRVIPLVLQASLDNGYRLLSGGPYFCLPPSWYKIYFFVVADLLRLRLPLIFRRVVHLFPALVV